MGAVCHCLQHHTGEDRRSWCTCVEFAAVSAGLYQLKVLEQFWGFAAAVCLQHLWAVQQLLELRRFCLLLFFGACDCSRGCRIVCRSTAVFGFVAVL